MTVYLWAFVIALVVTYICTPLVKQFAVKVGAIDKPDARKVHQVSIPRLGGLAIYIGYMVSLLYSVKDVSSVKGLIVGSIILVAVGIWDDIKQIGPKTKLMGQILPSIVFRIFCYTVDGILDCRIYEYCESH